MVLINLDFSETFNVDVFQVTGVTRKQESEYGLHEFYILSGCGENKNTDSKCYYAIDNVSRVVFSAIKDGKRIIINEPLELYLKDYCEIQVFDISTFLKHSGYGGYISEWTGNYRKTIDFFAGTDNALHFYRTDGGIGGGDFYFADGTLTVDGETVSEVHWRYCNINDVTIAEQPENNWLLDEKYTCDSNELLLKLKPCDDAEFDKVCLSTYTDTYCYIPDGSGMFKKLDFAGDFFLPELNDRGISEKDYYKWLINITSCGYAIEYDVNRAFYESVIVFAPGAMLFKGEEIRYIKTWARSEIESKCADEKLIADILSAAHRYTKPSELITIDELKRKTFYGDFSMTVHTESDTLLYELGVGDDAYSCVFTAEVGDERIILKCLDDYPDTDGANELFYSILNSEELDSIENKLKKARLLNLGADFEVIRQKRRS